MRQLTALRDDRAQFQAQDTAILGINPGSQASHQKFCDKYELSFPLLGDDARHVAQTYGALKENGTSIQRTVFIVDKEGTLRYAKQGMPSDQELLRAIASF